MNSKIITKSLCDVHQRTEPVSVQSVYKLRLSSTTAIGIWHVAVVDAGRNWGTWPRYNLLPRIQLKISRSRNTFSKKKSSIKSSNFGKFLYCTGRYCHTLYQCVVNPKTRIYDFFRVTNEFIYQYQQRMMAMTSSALCVVRVCHCQWC